MEAPSPLASRHIPQLTHGPTMAMEIRSHQALAVLRGIGLDVLAFRSRVAGLFPLLINPCRWLRFASLSLTTYFLTLISLEAMAQSPLRLIRLYDVGVARI